MGNIFSAEDSSMDKDRKNKENMERLEKMRQKLREKKVIVDVKV
jgi:hypothetical protein